MFVFKKEQETVEIAGIKIGGQPGENPTVLVGGLFFKGQPVVENMKEGRFDSDLTRQWIDTANMMVEITGHPAIIQVYGRTPTAMERHIPWIAENFDGPFMFESTSAKARIRAIELCDEMGLSDRAIYNSINLSMKGDEKEVLQQSTINSAVVLGWSPRAMSLPDRMEVVTSMIDLARTLGIERMLVDPATLPVGAGYGLEYRTTLAIKSELGLPTCLGPHNAPSAWRFLRREGFNDEAAHLSAIVAATVAAQVLSTDAVMYGSMIRTREVFTAVALIGNALAASAAEVQHALGEDIPLFDPKTAE